MTISPPRAAGQTRQVCDQPAHVEATVRAARGLADADDASPPSDAMDDLRREVLNRSKWLADELGGERPQEKEIAAGVDRRLGRLGVAVIATDLKGTIRHWNLGAERLYGWLRAEVLGRPITELTVGPEDADVAESVMDHVRRTGSWQGEFWLRRRDGTPLLAYVQNAILRDERGRAIGIIGVSVDASADERASFPD